ncbi:MCE family protein [Actinophytocola oryzae]|uniref:Virulence factor Mce-like protein n=1 Tax=Actinophytocola oryzae TaxID=502181 RepID=A0A4R7UX41_9PSEU|nr:MCE family protein [Actinophytocola oryzae]TDV41388.1 virulence factor Mce-like protein [Actinophytocola oryzae]
MNETRARRRLGRAVAITLVLGVLTAGALWWIFGGDDEKRVTAYFSRAVGVYAGSDVQVLGVKVGTVESVTPRGNRVEVVFTVDRDVPVARDTKAVVIAPSVVSDRYVQLTDVGGGRPIEDGAIIPESRTATPVELDELYASLNTIITALGPEGANKDGALSDLLDTGAANLEGNGKAFNESVRNFADAARTLNGSAGDLFATIDELQSFTHMLATNDKQVRDVNTQLAQVTQTLAADRDELGTALATLGDALADIQAFIKDNRLAIKSNVDKLARTTQLLVDNRASLAEALDVAPLAVTNVVQAWDPASGTLQGRGLLLEYFGDTAPALPLPITDGVPLDGGR